jgi:ligand-binding sensor domain-containing protein
VDAFIEGLDSLASPVWSKLTSPSTMRLLAPPIGIALFWLLSRWYARAGRSALGRAVRWWCLALTMGAVFAGVVYLLSVLPDDPEALEVMRSVGEDRAGRVLFPAPLAVAGALLAAAAALAAAWRWRQARLRPAEAVALWAEWQRVRSRWTRRLAIGGGVVAAAMGAACAVATTGAPQVPPMAPAAQPTGGALWVGTAAGVSRLRVAGQAAPRWEAFARPRAPLPADQVTGIVAGPQGEVWLSTRGGLVRFAEDEGRPDWRVKAAENGTLPNSVVLGLTVDREGGVWAATGGGGAALFPDGRNFAFTSGNAPLLHQILDTAYVDPAGRVWFGGAGGMNVYQPPLPGQDEGQWPVGFARATTNGALPDDLVHVVAGDTKGRVWFATAGGAAVLSPDPSAFGLGAFDPSRWQTFTTTNSPLSHDFVHAIAEDRQGHIWLGTRAGADVLEETAPGQFRWQHHGAGGPHGLPNPWVRSLLVAPDGRVWAGTHGGLAVYDPAQPGQGWLSFHANLLRRWTGYLWPPFWQQNILSDDVTALAWGP